MIITQKKPIEEVMALVGDAKTVAIVGCNSCATACQTGGEPQIKELAAILEAAGIGYENVVKTTCFLADMADFAAFNEVYARYFVSKPARSCVAVKTLPKNVLCEIEAIAEK